MIFERITIIGLGLIGSSIARAARDHQLAATIVGCDQNDISLAFARKHKFIDTATNDPLAAVKNSDLVILATPPSTLASVAEAITPHLKPGAIVMDTASIKQAAMKAIAPHLPRRVDFMPAHPIAGSEHTGVSAGRADLFERKHVIVTPNEPEVTKASRTSPLSGKPWVRALKAMPAALHDVIYAYVSHLPQLLAFAAAS